MEKKFQYSFIDRFLVEFDRALQTCVPNSINCMRNSPAENLAEENLEASEKKHIAGLMRINHTGEVCAQALYAGQSATARLNKTRKSMEQAALEEMDHLAWCNERLPQLESQPSLFNPIFYGLSFGVGAIAGLAGDKWSLGFVAETEQQVCKHLEDHLSAMPKHDKKSRAILKQMIIDEKNHGETAKQAGGMDLPVPIKQTMAYASQIMKNITYHI